MIPALPGVPLVFLGILIYAFYTNFTIISLSTILLFAGLMILSIIVDYTSGLIGAKKLGATKYGIWGGLIGLLIGLVFSPFGFISVILMPLVGTITGELIGGKKIFESSQIGIGTLIGYLIAIIIDLSIAGWMILTFVKIIV
ncbi:hypothetical protein A3F08_01815 [Candidatus Berkelbacteria bacterium RIFCSPHIGHO2_12_FULL_36_9]|uniref:DUF456 domain-containing protein n=1 Tax=Candidatus Berkelbacteria bacterium RIFCSPHIGHO2_12_FULL_36_9 TaxID=1797469 RepID=A0A1F5EEJ6_9BACT|nr:MAG: hypothetical protein A3F08_01815 [Candidatus Berkelbacteria bacterium RIFCSPHIGHO2_12_FULL_36_9]